MSFNPCGGILSSNRPEMWMQSDLSFEYFKYYTLFVITTLVASFKLCKRAAYINENVILESKNSVIG